MILGTPPLPADNLTGGKVVFISDRVDPPQVFTQQVGSPGEPQQLSSVSLGARYPVWAPDGEFIAYITQEVCLCIPSQGLIDVLYIIDKEGTEVKKYFPSDLFNTTSVKYPQWSRDGKKIIFTYYDDFSDRTLGVLEFDTPYDFENFRVYTVVPPNMEAVGGVFSGDGTEIYFHANGAELHRVPVNGGTPLMMYGNGGIGISSSFS